MAGDDTYLDDLLSRLSLCNPAAKDLPVVVAAPCPGLPTVAPAAPQAAARAGQAAAKLGKSRRESRVEHLRRPGPAPAAAAQPAPQGFVPPVPRSLIDAKLSEAEVQALILKFLLYHITATGREVADQIKLPFCLAEQQLSQLKADQLVVHKGSAPLGDFVFQLTAAGQDDARRLNRHGSYFGATPVHLDDYIASVHAQSITRHPLTIEELDDALGDLVVEPNLKNQVGQALFAGHGFFIYGAPGNGKTSIAERIGRAYGQTIWIPRALGVEGEIIRLYDPGKHTEAPILPEEEVDTAGLDQRWIRIKCPTIIVGGELTLERLEITINTHTGTGEAPMQLKSNCGVLVIDDFGRQRMSTSELLNRWIVPLDKRHDYLNLRSGKTIQVPFDQLLVFSTNLEPKDLVDEAFLRRIPYKIEVFDPSEAVFRELLKMYADRLGVEYAAEAVDYLIGHHYQSCGRPYRYCHARDLLLHVRNCCLFNRRPVRMSAETFDMAVRNYFAIMGG